MTPRETRRALKQQQKALRAQFARLRREARARVAADPIVQQARRKRVRDRLAYLLAFLLLLFFARCECDKPASRPPEPPKVVEPTPPPEPRKAAPAPKKPAPLKARTEPAARAGMALGQLAPPSWLDELHLQVSARSPRLAKCFEGSQGPGALRWQATLNPESGAVADQMLEPVGVSTDLGKAQRECLMRVLAYPPYRLTVPEKLPLPDRVSMVIEF